MKLKTKFKINVGMLVGSIITIILGLVLIIFSKQSGLLYAVQALIGIIIIAVNGNNLYQLITRRRNDQNYKYRLLGYIVNIFIGILLIFSPGDTFRTVVLIFLIILPIIQIIYFGNINEIKEAAILQIFLGIILLIIGLNGIVTAVFVMVGVLLLLIGIFNLLAAFSVLKYKN